MPFVYLPEVDSVMVRITKAASTSIIRSGFSIDHDSLQTAMQLPQTWAQKFRFAFVRNPFDRLVSAWQMFQKHPSAIDSGFDARELTMRQVMQVVEDDSIDLYQQGYWARLKRHAIPMTHPHYRIGEANFIGRFEKLEQDWRSLGEAMSVQLPPLKRFKSSGRSEHYSAFYDAQARDAARRVYAEDLERFGYRFESGWQESGWQKSGLRQAG